jgi:hypothetical protein
MTNYQNLSWDDIKAMYAQTAQLMKENELRLSKMIEENRKQYAENRNLSRRR